MRFKLVLVMLLTLALPSVTLSAVSNPEHVRQEARQQVEIGSRLIRDAQALLVKGVNKSNARAALLLYIEAGKLFERTTAQYEQLVPQYVSEEDLQNAQGALMHCVSKAEELKRYLMQ